MELSLTFNGLLNCLRCIPASRIVRTVVADHVAEYLVCVLVLGLQERGLALMLDVFIPVSGFTFRLLLLLFLGAL